MESIKLKDMETNGGFLSRIAERALTWIVLGLLVAVGIAIWRMSPQTRDAIWNGIWRTCAWFFIAAATPWAARFFIRRIQELSFDTHWAPFGLLAAMFLVDLAAGALLLTGWPSGFWGWFASLSALAVAMTYNYLVAEYLTEQFGG